MKYTPCIFPSFLGIWFTTTVIDFIRSTTCALSSQLPGPNDKHCCWDYISTVDRLEHVIHRTISHPTHPPKRYIHFSLYFAIRIVMGKGLSPYFISIYPFNNIPWLIGFSQPFLPIVTHLCSLVGAGCQYWFNWAVIHYLDQYGDDGYSPRSIKEENNENDWYLSNSYIHASVASTYTILCYQQTCYIWIQLHEINVCILTYRIAIYNIIV